MITIFGIRNCDTVKKALKWAEENGIEYQFHDYRKAPLSEDMIANWLDRIDRGILINKRGTTYRKLTDDQKNLLEGEAAGATGLLIEQPTIMKRPLFDINGHFVVGFKEIEKEAVLAAL